MFFLQDVLRIKKTRKKENKNKIITIENNPKFFLSNFFKALLIMNTDGKNTYGRIIVVYLVRTRHL